MTPRLERHALQALVTIGAVVPVAAGGVGIALGPGSFGATGASADLASHLAYLSGLVLAVGIGFWSCVPGIERRGRRIGLLATLVVAGGLARLVALVLHGVLSLTHLLPLGMELGATPPAACGRRERLRGPRLRPRRLLPATCR